MAKRRAATKPAGIPTRALAGGRVSADTPGLFSGLTPTVVAPPDHESDWRRQDLDTAALSRVPPSRLLQMLADISPDLSRALWDFARLCNPGWEVTALRPGTDEQDELAQAALDRFLGQLREQYGPVDVVIGRLYVAAYLRGAFLAELVLDERGREPLDLATLDPTAVRFKRIPDPVRGTVWQLGQWQGGKWVSLDIPTVRYVPVDPFPGSPYGRPIAAPALFTTLFLIGLLHDLRRVVQQQGYMRLDLGVNLEALRENCPSDVEVGSTEYAEWVGSIVAEIREVYAGLQPDDAYIHTDLVTVNRPVGTADASSLGGITGLIELLERHAVRALKTNPLLMAMNDGLSEASANRLWEAHLQGVKAIQHLCEDLLEHLLSLALQAQGIAASVRFRFAENRASEMMRDAQTERLRIENARAKYAAGWVSQEEASLEVTGHPPDQAEPREQTVDGMPDPDSLADANPEPGADRARSSHRATRDKLVPKGTDKPFAPLPAEVTYSASDKRALLDTWDDTLGDYAGLLDAEVVANGSAD